MWKILRSLTVAMFIFHPGYSQANITGQKQISKITIVTDQGEVLSADAPNGVLKKIEYSSHSDKWIIGPKDIDLHNGKIALQALHFTYGPFKNKAGLLRTVAVLSIPVVFSTKKDGNIKYDEGRLDINFYEGGDASIDLWREQYSDYVIEHVSVKQTREEKH